MAAKMKLTYFDMRGLAENIRLIMAQAGVDYEDCRIEKGQWPGMKDCKCTLFYELSYQIYFSTGSF